MSERDHKLPSSPAFIHSLRLLSGMNGCEGTKIRIHSGLLSVKDHDE